MTYEASNTEGKGKLPFDGMVGNLVNGTIAAALLYVAQAVGSFDFTPLPDALEPLAVAGAGLFVGLITTKILPRFSKGSRTR